MVVTSKLTRAYRRAALLDALAEGPQSQRALAERLGVSPKLIAIMTRRPDIEATGEMRNNRFHRMYRLKETA